MTSGSLILRGFLLGILIYVLALVFATIRTANAQDYGARLDRCKPYRVEVERILDEERVSPKYYYLMVAESGCSENAVSSRGARGFWQLMPKTAVHYGCMNPDNLECSTRAAARYLRHLEAMFRHFDEIIAAYNMGGHNLKRNGKTKEALGLVMTVHRLMAASK